jgi:hypothetical protein
VLLNPNSAHFAELKAICEEYGVTIKTTAMISAGIPIGQTADRRGLLHQKFRETTEDLQALADINDPQTALLLFRHALSRSEYIMRNMDSKLIEPEALAYHQAAKEVLAQVLQLHQYPTFGNEQQHIQTLAFLPLHLGGLGLMDMHARAPFSRLTGILQYALNIGHISNELTLLTEDNKLVLEALAIFDAHIAPRPELAALPCMPTRDQLQNLLVVGANGTATNAAFRLTQGWQQSVMASVYWERHNQILQDEALSDHLKLNILHNGGGGAAHRFLLAIPVEPLSNFSPAEFRSTVRRRLGFDRHEAGQACRLCHDPDGGRPGHLSLCTKIPGIRRHDELTTILARFLGLIASRVTREVLIENSSKKRMDIIVQVLDGKSYWLDTSFASQYSKTNMVAFRLSRDAAGMKALDKRHSGKLAKYKAAVIKREHEMKTKIIMEPMVLSTAGVLHPKSDKFLGVMDKLARSMGMMGWKEELLTAMSCSLHKSNFWIECLSMARRDRCNAQITHVSVGGARRHMGSNVGFVW